MADGVKLATQATPEFKLDDLKVGKPDARGQPVQEIYWHTDDFRIYRTPHGLATMLSDDTDIAKTQRANYFHLSEDISEFRQLLQTMRPLTLPVSGFVLPSTPAKSRVLDHYEREMARCIAMAVSGQVDEAKSFAEGLKSRLAARAGNRGRIFHLFISLLLTAVALGGGWLAAEYWTTSFFEFEPREIALAVMMGSLGALFSTSVRLRSMDVDPAAGIGMHIVYGGLRILVGALAAVILYFGFRSGVINGILQPVGDGLTPSADAPSTTVKLNLYWVAFVSILAGFSEQLVPNLLDNKAKSATKGESGSDADT